MKKILYFTAIALCCLQLTNCANDETGSNETTNPGDPSTGNPNDGKGGSLAVFAMKGNYLYTVDYKSLHVFQIANPSNPIKVNDVQIGFDIETLYSLDNYLFMGAQSGMYIYDITNPENPIKMSESRHFTACDPVVANQTHAFVTLHSNTACGGNINRLMVYDIADVKNPQLVHERNLVGPKGLALHDNYLIVCDDELKIFDVSNPAEPTLLGSINKKYTDVVIYNNILFAFGSNQISQYKWKNNDLNTLEEISSLNY
ncbi:MAG TPA: hypothetical protein VLY87_01840 [Flavobacterium sp.]|nr:hypothetical protein [Flavobacterium sp.]